ncbi:MAG: rod shape-determining protein [Chlamydiales bacterium]|nr:rod shape-determining protein [Chlamydiales bacterium]
MATEATISHSESDSLLSYSSVESRPHVCQASSPTMQLAPYVAATLDVKLENKAEIEAKRENFWEKYKITDFDSDFWLVAGDFFSMGYLGFEAAQSFAPSLQKVSWVGTASMVFGIIGGIINIAVGISCIAQGIKKLNKGQNLDGARLLFDGILMILIGTLMIAGPLLLKFAAGAAITALATNPFVLPVLFALLSVFITYEVLKKVVPMWMGTDLGTQVMKKLEDLTTDDKIIDLFNLLLPKTIKVEEDGEEKELEVNLEALKGWIKEGKEDIVKKVMCESMNQLEAKVGLETSLEMFELMQSLIALLGAHETEVALMDQGQISEVQASVLGQLVDEKVALEIQEKLDLAGSDTFERITHAVLTSFKEHQEEESAQLQDRVVVPIKHYQAEDEHIEQFVRAKLEQILQHQKIEKKKPELQSQVRKWKIIQHVRLAQQILYIGASVATFATFLPKANANMINGVVNTSMSLANFIPLLLDKWDTCKFYRNVPVDVPGVTVEALTKRLAAGPSNPYKEESVI